ncbi:VOC family protein [Virgibacillus ihumii]|uniref:VOC family protein n=1 Tax=Virgibacillus ihumii TaxID=2686091 RepID=UPI00157C8C80|nr:VOC family protein [Virgibacillus ihumii]
MKINKVTMYSNHLEKMKDFYVENLGFELLNKDEKGFELKAGESVLEFRENNLDSEPYYHFALNISYNLFRQAKEWAFEKMELNTEGGDDEAHFEFLNSKSIYFFDPGGNIVEFIARKSYPNSGAATFTVNDVLNISEMSLTVNDVIGIAGKIIERGVPVRENESVDANSLNFMGEAEEGAFLLLGPSERRWIFSDKDSEVHPVRIQVNHNLFIEMDGSGKLKIC